MNFIQRAQELARKIPELKKLQDERHRLEQYEAHKEKLVAMTSVLAGLAFIAQELRVRGVEISGFKRPVQGMLSETMRVVDAFKKDRGVIIAPETIETFWHPLEGMPGRVKNVLEKVWKEYVQAKIPSGQTEILDILSKVQGFQVQVATVKKLRTDMSELGQKLPDEEDLEILDTLTEQVKHAWNELNGDGLPLAVLVFLKKAHTTGISLADLDSEVLEWLRNHSLMGKYVVRGR